MKSEETEAEMHQAPSDPQIARRLLAEGQFVPFFQPVVTLPTGELAGFEVLARWQHPVKGCISPQHFIATAEQSGWIDALTREILQRAFVAASAIPESLTLAVNISPVELRDPALPEKIRCLAKEANFALNRLTVEITESALIDDLESAGRILLALKQMGCKLALDDFGTGYSSLHHLQSLPFNELKVDRSFVSSMTKKRESRQIVAAVVGLGQSLGLITVAEGIETREQAEMMLWLGCEYGQGHFYGKPLPAEELRKAVSEFQARAMDRRSNTWNARCGVHPAGPLSQAFAQPLRELRDEASPNLTFIDQSLRYLSLNKTLADVSDEVIQKPLTDASSLSHSCGTAAESETAASSLLAGGLRFNGDMSTSDVMSEEERRHQALLDLSILHTPAEAEFDEIVALASEICGAPISQISLLDTDYQWIKASVGIAARETPIIHSFCAHAIRQEGLFLVEDASVDARFVSNPMVVGDPGIRFYAGMPLYTAEGVAIGALCVVDTVSRTLSAGQARALTILSRQVQARLELRSEREHLLQALSANRKLTDELRHGNQILAYANQQLERLATIDPLTCLLNRRSFEDKVDADFSSALRKQHPLSILVLDVDDFKERNDSYGHRVGDEALRHVGSVLRKVLRSADSAARTGGEEFAVILPEATLEHAYTVACRIQDLLSTVGSEDLPCVTMSIGAACLSPDTSNWEMLFSHADSAMYEAKRTGKNRIVLF